MNQSKQKKQTKTKKKEKESKLTFSVCIFVGCLSFIIQKYFIFERFKQIIIV